MWRVSTSSLLRTYVRAIAEALGGHCVMLRRTEIGPFPVEEADPERIIPPEEALASDYHVNVASLPRTSSACPRRWRSGASTACIEAIAPCSRRAHGAGVDGDHVRPAPSDRTREQGRPPDHPRAQARADHGRRCRDGARRAVHVGAAAADSGGVRSGLLARDRSRDRARGRGLPLRRPAVRRPRAAGATRVRRSSFLQGRRRVVDRDSSGDRRRGRRGCAAMLGGLSSSTGRSSPATSVGARWDIRRRTSYSSRTSPARGTGSAGSPAATARRSRQDESALGAPSGGSSPTCSTSRATSTGASCREVWERLREEAVFGSEDELVAQIARDVEATRAARRPA